MMDTKDNVFREASLKGVDVEDLKLATSKMKAVGKVSKYKIPSK